MNNAEQIGKKLEEKATYFIEKFKSGNPLQKFLWIFAIIGVICIALIPFIIYVMFFQKDQPIEVDVDVEVIGHENNDGVPKKDLDDAVSKGEDVLAKLKKNKKDRNRKPSDR